MGISTWPTTRHSQGETVPDRTINDEKWSIEERNTYVSGRIQGFAIQHSRHKVEFPTTAPMRAFPSCVPGGKVSVGKFLGVRERMVRLGVDVSGWLHLCSARGRRLRKAVAFRSEGPATRLQRRRMICESHFAALSRLSVVRGRDARVRLTPDPRHGDGFGRCLGIARTVRGAIARKRRPGRAEDGYIVHGNERSPGVVARCR